MHTMGELADELRVAQKQIEFLKRQLQVERERTALERQRAAAHEASTRAAYRQLTGRSRVADDSTD